MSDNIRLVVPSKETEKQPATARRLTIFIIIFLVVALLLSLFLLSNSTALDGLKRFFHYFGIDRSTYGTISFENEGIFAFSSLDDCLVLGDDTTVSLYAEDGKRIAVCCKDYAAPALKSRGDYVLAYDIGGTQFVLISKDGAFSEEIKTENPIYDADLSENGAFCVLTEGTDCHAALLVYDDNGELCFRHNSKTGYLNRCALSPDGKQVVVAALGQKDAAFSGSVQVYNTSAKEVYAELSLGSQMIYDLFFLDGKTICAAGENSLFFFQPEGTLLNEYTSERGELITYSYSQDGYVAALLDMYDAESQYYLVTLDKDGSVIGYAAIGERPSCLSVSKQYVGILTEKELKLYNRELEPQNAIANAGWQVLCVRSDGTAYGLSQGEAKLYIP